MDHQMLGSGVDLDADAVTVVQGNTQFALDLYKQMRTTDGNLFFSPYSLSVALGMTLAGARGDTETQMTQTLHLDLDRNRLHPAFAALESRLGTVKERGHVELRVANALWPHRGYPFLEEFLALVKQYYGVLITPLDYSKEKSAREAINAWVEDKTEGKIRDLLAPGVLNAMTRLVLTNAIYFKGDWAKQFDEGRTQDATFWVTAAEHVKVPMMSQVDTFGYSAREPGLQILELPYAGDDLSMIVLLPEKLDGIGELENALTVANLTRWTCDLRRMEVEVHLPRFKMSCQFELADTLKSLGIRDAFDGADFSGMDGTKMLYIWAVIHKAYVDVTEQGTEAAAATAVVMAMRSLPLPPPVFRADHPFVFLIRENSTGSVLFLGRVMNPNSGAA
jgi:serpin B